MVGPSGRMTVPAAGFTVLVNPDQPSLDVVFVHGFKGSPTGTWTKRGIDRSDHRSDHDNEPDEPPSKARKLGFLSRPHQGTNPDTSSCFWPQELLPEILPTARVLTYGYDTKIQHVADRPVSTATIYDIAWDFLVALEAERQDDPPRPILFIAHSLGGIVVKEMLRRSSGCLSAQTHLHAIFESTIGIVFFGTPHGGANPHGFLVHIAKKFFKAIGYEANESIINGLLPNSERLRELTDCFGTMAEQRKWIIHSFQELDRVKILRQKVVEDEASRLNIPAIEVTEHICDDHMGMSKFSGINDPEFKKVAAALRRITHSKSGSLGQSKTHSLTEEQKEALMGSLDFEQLDARHTSIKSAHAKTCKWILKKSEYVDWLNPSLLVQHHGFLWIKGKPGAGKSTLMKFALANARRTMKNRIIINFFFNARGDDLERSTIGMYRSLLLQLLTQLPALKSVFDSLRPVQSSRGCPNWNLELLKTLFETAIQRLGNTPLVCFIDALDECDESQIREMVSFWGHLGELAVVKKLSFLVCYSSRHYPHITIDTGHISLILERQEGHAQDIVNYVDTELKIGKTKLAEKIRIELQEKASGVFMWVVLVVRILNKEHDSGRVHLLQQRLKTIPGDLHELFRDILKRDAQNKNELLLCLQWVLFSRTPLKPEQLYFAIIAAASPDCVFRWDSDEISEGDIMRYILHCSKGLAEATKSKQPTIQFIHESVRDFLLKDKGLNSLWLDLGDQIEGRSYEQLKQSCLQYIKADIWKDMEIRNNVLIPLILQPDGTVKPVSASFPFLEHAVRNVLYYADRAGSCGISQEDFLKTFSELDYLQRWIGLHNLFEKFQVRHYTLQASLLYILAEANTPNLIGYYHPITSCLNVEGQRYGCALLAAIATKSKQSLQAFREGLLKMLPAAIATRILPIQDDHEHRTIQVNRDLKFSHSEPLISQIAQCADRTLFIVAAETLGAPLMIDRWFKTTALADAVTGSMEVLEILITTNMIDVNSKDIEGNTIFLWAASTGRTEIVSLILHTGKIEDVNVRDNDGFTALGLAARAGNVELSNLLLQTDKVEINSRDNYGWTPLSRAAASGSKEVVNLLLQTRAVKINSTDELGRTPFLWAASAGNMEVVQLLLQTGRIDVNTKDCKGWTALAFAAVAGSIDVIKLLLKTGEVDVDSKDNYGLTPLTRAASAGHTEVVKLLLQTDRVDADSRDCDGCTPLARAASDGHKEVVKLLLQTACVDADSKGWKGRTPLLWAASAGREEVVRLLLQTGRIDVDRKDGSGRTPLSCAAGNGFEEVVSLLLQTGKVDIYSKDHKGYTPAWWASQFGQTKVLELLLQAGGAGRM